MTYTYTIFDSDPSARSGTAWPSHQNMALDADDVSSAIDAVADVMSVEAASLNATDGYDVGQRLYALIWDEDGAIVGEPTYELTDSDLGIERDCEDE